MRKERNIFEENTEYRLDSLEKNIRQTNNRILKNEILLQTIQKSLNDLPQKIDSEYRETIRRFNKRTKNNLIEPKEVYYFYHNWNSSNRVKNKIHSGSCSMCNYGEGKQGIEERGKNSIWIGPFETPELVEKYLEKRLKIDPKGRRHKCVVIQDINL